MIGKKSGENEEEQMRRKETLATEGREGEERREGGREEERGRERSREEREVARLWSGIVKIVFIYITQT